MPPSGFFDLLIKADTLDELAKKIKASSEVLQQTVTDFNRFSKDGRDIQFGRNTTTMRAFGAGPYYAAPLVNTMLNTQGGPEKNEKGQVLDWDNQPIHHLYEAGEFGGLTGRLYNGATNLSECLIFGKIAGENVVKESSLATTDATTSPSQKSDNLGKNDILDAETSTVISVGPHQYIGTSNLGMGGTVSARITYQKGQLEKVELPGNHETEGIGSRAVRELPDQMVKNNTYAVDAISGATTSSNAIKQAVKNALDQVDAE